MMVTKRTPVRQVQTGEDLSSFCPRRFNARGIESVVNRADFSCRQSFFQDQLLPYRFAIRNDRVGHSVGTTFDKSLTGRSHRGFTTRSNAHRNTREGRTRHAENVRVKVVTMHHVDLVLLQKLREATNLFRRMQIVKTVESKFRDVFKTQSVDLIQQHAFAFERGHKNITASALQQQSR